MRQERARESMGVGTGFGWVVYFSCPTSFELQCSCEQWEITQLFRKVGEQA